MQGDPSTETFRSWRSSYFNILTVSMTHPPLNSDSLLLHLHPLLFAVQTALTTAGCVVEYELPAAEKSTLGGFYIPYFVCGK